MFFFCCNLLKITLCFISAYLHKIIVLNFVIFFCSSNNAGCSGGTQRKTRGGPFDNMCGAAQFCQCPFGRDAYEIQQRQSTGEA